MNNLDWLENIKADVIHFLSHQESDIQPGYYKYSYSGDLLDDSRHWNIGSSVYALKIFYTIGIEKNDKIVDACQYIKSFSGKDGLIFDDVINKRAFLRNFLLSIRARKWNNLGNQEYKRAENRQALSALCLYDELPESVIVSIPESESEVVQFLESLYWSNSWNAGSHFSHLMFNLSVAKNTGQINNEMYSSLLIASVHWLETVYNEDTGGWYTGSQSSRYIINGAMKVISGLNAAYEHFSIKGAELLIDLCLSELKGDNACDYLNIMYVLKYAAASLDDTYRIDEIRDFAVKLLDKYHQYFYKEQGGFSFHLHKSAYNYYGATITRGLNECDMHGTVLFLWGIAIIISVLGLEETVPLQIFQT